MLNMHNYETEYLLTLMRCALIGEQVPVPPENIDWQRLIDISKKQQIYSMLVHVLDLKVLPQEQAQELNNYSKSELVKMIAVQNELAAIEQLLQENEIKYMLLKGGVIRNYYPKQSMRQMSDFDILYDESKRESLIKMMNERGYNLFSCGENSDDFSKKPYYTFEFHRELFYNEHIFCPDFSDVWENAVQDSNNSCKFNMSDEDLYLHTVAHMYKHYILGGFGIRFLADIYVLLEHFGKTVNRKYIDEKLKRMELTSFENEVKEVAYAVFDDKEITQNQAEFLSKMLSFGVYGSGEGGAKVYYDEYVAKHGKTSVAGYYLSKVFPDKRFMKQLYPVLEKKPYLLPLCYIKRLFHKLLHERKFILGNIKSLKKALKEENKN